MENYTLPDFNIDFGNFDPQDITSDETINAVLVVDISPSISSYVNELNDAFTDFLEEMQRSHVAEKLMVSITEFNDTVNNRNGFQPVETLKSDQINFKPCGMGTALYDAVFSSIENAVNYRTNLENSGVNCKTLVFIITDGQDNYSKIDAQSINRRLSSITTNESSAFSFETILFGVGNDNSFEKAQKDMGIKHLARVGNTATEIRKMIGFISASISQSFVANSAISF